MSDHRTVLSGLYVRWRVLALSSLAVLVLGSIGLRLVWPTNNRLGWAALTTAVLTAELILLRRHLTGNHRPGETALLPGLGLGNLITLSRGLMLAAFAGFLAAPLPLTFQMAWLMAGLYAATVLPDFLDGYLARTTNHVTVLGAILDMEYDSLAMLAVSLIAVRLGKVPWWYISLGFARYIFVAGLWLRARRNLPTYDLTPSTVRRLAAGYQMVFFCVLLTPIFVPPATTVASILFVTPILVGFVRDWLVVSGAICPTAPAYQLYERIYGQVARWLPLIWRVSSGVVTAAFLVPSLRHAARIEGNLWPICFALLASTSAGLLALGVAARLAAIGLLAAVYADLAWGGFQPYHAGLMVCSVPILYLGAGALALWRGEDQLFTHRAGERWDQH